MVEMVGKDDDGGGIWEGCKLDCVLEIFNATERREWERLGLERPYLECPYLEGPIRKSSNPIGKSSSDDSMSFSAISSPAIPFVVDLSAVSSVTTSAIDLIFPSFVNSSNPVGICQFIAAEAIDAIPPTTVAPSLALAIAPCSAALATLFEGGVGEIPVPVGLGIGEAFPRHISL